MHLGPVDLPQVRWSDGKSQLGEKLHKRFRKYLVFHVRLSQDQHNVADLLGLLVVYVARALACTHTERLPIEDSSAWRIVIAKVKRMRRAAREGYVITANSVDRVENWA